MASENSIQDTLSSLTGMLQKKEEELATKKRKLSEEWEALEREKRAVYTNTKPSDVLCLNVGGKIIHVLRRTLTSVPDSMLASRFSGRWDDSLEKDKDGNFFIDQKYELFELVVDYLRNRSNGIGKYSMKSPCINDHTEMENFYRMLEYYGITHGIYPTTLEIRHGSEGDIETKSPWKVNTKEWTTFKIERQGHYRHIKTYQVVVGSVQRIQIGWGYHDISNAIKTDFDQDSMLGAGDVKHTSAIDLLRSSFLFSGASTAIDGLHPTEGTVVRSENYGTEWYVNDKLVATCSETRENGVVQCKEPKRLGDQVVKEKVYGGTTTETTYNYYRSSNMFPLISVKGEFEITALKFSD